MRRSWLREVMPSLANTLPRWYCTVRGDRNSRAPISGLDSPSRASRAICASCAVSSRRGGCRAFAGGLAGGQQLAAGPLGERLHADGVEHAVRGAQLLAGLAAPALAAQPLAVQQVGAGQFGAQPGAAEPLDRLAVQALGLLALAQQRPGPRLDPQPPVGAAGPGRFRSAGPARRWPRAVLPVRAAASISSGSAHAR